MLVPETFASQRQLWCGENAHQLLHHGSTVRSTVPGESLLPFRRKGLPARDSPGATDAGSRGVTSCLPNSPRLPLVPAGGQRRLSRLSTDRHLLHRTFCGIECCRDAADEPL